MAYTTLEHSGPQRTYDEKGLEYHALKFIRESCEGLRFDPGKEHEQEYTGKSIGKDQIPYNMEKDIDRLCLERAVERFLNSGKKEDAFDVYFCYLEMFVGSYGNSRMMIEMLSEFESNGSSLLMKHRDHYSHSVYVFALGLAIYETNQAYREAYRKFYKDALEDSDEHQIAHHFLEFWGLAALFHDIGYPFELPFEQVESYFEVRREKRKNNPYVAYIGMEKFVQIEPDAQARLQKIYGKEFATTDELFAYDIAKKLGDKYHITKDSMEMMLATKPSNPNRFGYYMDHAYFSASILFQELYAADCKAKKDGFSRERIDALTAIILHNSLYKFSVAFYKSDCNRPLEMSSHPLAYILMLCDELQCWDRTSYGRNSRSELHPMECEFQFQGNEIQAAYIYDEAEQAKIDRYEKKYAEWDGKTEISKPELKAYASMVHDNSFLSDIKKIVKMSPDTLDLQVTVETKKADYGRKKVFLSDSNFIHLYNFAVALNARYSHDGHEDDPEIKLVMEQEFDDLSLEYKLSNIGQAKAFAGYLNIIHCVYTDKPVDMQLVPEILPQDMVKIGPLEHERWLREHEAMGWTYADDYKDKNERELRRVHKLMMDGEITSEKAAAHYAKLPEEEQDKDTKPMNSMLKLIRQFDGVRIYRLPELEK
jgi:hypothetical protein